MLVGAAERLPEIELHILERPAPAGNDGECV
jgi:hypothetical protein